MLLPKRLGLVCLLCGFAATQEPKRQTYDYIIVGGGTSGLTVAGRLSENPKTTVLVIERGTFDNKPEAIVPWYGNLLDTSVMEFFPSSPIPGLGNRVASVPVASVVGGATVVNGEAYMRGSAPDYDAWEALGNPGWGWNGLLPYFKKSTTFTPPSAAVAQEWNMTWDESVWDSGPVHVTIPDFQYTDLHPFFDAWDHVAGVQRKRDIGAGEGPGIYWIPSTIDRRNQTRETSRSAYYDAIFAERPNLKLLTGTKVTEIILENQRAKGVKIASSSGTSEVFARKEVIMAAGSAYTPQLLQVSGLGPKSVLQAAGIKVKKEIPGIGANFQDHATIPMTFNLSHQSFPNPNTILTNATYNASVWQEYLDHKTGPIAAGSSSLGVGLSLPQVLSPPSSSKLNANTLISSLLAQKALSYLPEIYSTYPSLLRGFLKQRSILASRLSTRTSVCSQFPFTGANFAFSSFQKPLSRGYLALNASNPSGPPVVQYNTLSNPIDTQILLSQVRFARGFWNSPPLSTSYLAPLIENAPGAQYQTDEEILGWFRGNLNPGLAHLSGTCAMMPEELGGVVGPDLKVYGVKGLRVVDASVIPLIPAATLQATVYAIAEKAADLIKKDS